MFVFLLLCSCRDTPSSQLLIKPIESQAEITDWSIEASLDTIPDEADFEYFARISLDLRAKRPSIEELLAYESAPENLEFFVDNWLSEPAFPKQMAWFWNDALHTAVWASQVDVWRMLPFETRKALGWEPLSFIEAIIRDDLPFSDLVTTTKMPTNQLIGEIWDMEGDDDWSWSEPVDGRPMAGILSSRFLWTRYKVDFLNENRRRANHFSRMFLCHDYLEREVDFSFDILAESLSDMDTAIQTLPACTSCHSSLDPLASFFGAFQLSTNLTVAQTGGISDFKAEWYSNLRAPSYFGKPGQDISDLGQYTAEDSRFTQCSVQRVWEGFLGDSPERDSDFLALVQEFERQGKSVKKLAKTLVFSQNYRLQEQKLLRPEQLSGIIQDILKIDEGTDTDGIGPLIWSPKYRVLFGAGNDYSILEQNTSFTVGSHLIFEWLATPISEAIDLDLQRPLQDREIIFVTQEDEDSIRTQISDWAMQLLSSPFDSDDTMIDALFQLWTNTQAEYGTTSAWTTVFLALLHHPDTVTR